MSKRQKEIIKVFLFLFALSFLIINWNNVSWVFNYRVTGALIYDFFNPYQIGNIATSADSRLSEKNLNFIAILSGQNAAFSQKNGSIEIPKIGISAPLIISEDDSEKTISEKLNNGAVYYPGTALPGENGQTVILGHSAPPGWPKIKYDWVFSDINDLDIGDEIEVNFNNKKYIYRVIGQKIIEKGQEIQADGLNGKNNVLTLISCWPPGKNYKRIAVQAELVKNIAKY